MFEKNMTTRKDDMSAEQQLAKFLDMHLYSEFSSKCKCITRITDKTQQMQGIDVIIDYDNHDSVYIDEKAQLHYMDTCLETFAFEVSFVGNDNLLHKGWLHNHDLKTDTYILIWPKETIYHNIILSCDKNKRKDLIRDLLKTLKYDDFEKVECYFIKRETIKKFLETHGWNEERILAQASKIREKNKYFKTSIEGISSFYFYFSPPSSYGEQPINIVIRKNVLHDLAYNRFVVTKDKLIKI